MRLHAFEFKHLTKTYFCSFQLNNRSISSVEKNITRIMTCVFIWRSSVSAEGILSNGITILYDRFENGVEENGCGVLQGITHKRDWAKSCNSQYSWSAWPPKYEAGVVTIALHCTENADIVQEVRGSDTHNYVLPAATCLSSGWIVTGASCSEFEKVETRMK
jgi:hypothetical protein